MGCNWGVLDESGIDDPMCLRKVEMGIKNQMQLAPG